MIITISQQDLERLLQESKQIASDWNTYVQFRRNRDAVLKELMAEEGLN